MYLMLGYIFIIYFVYVELSSCKGSATAFEKVIPAYQPPYSDHFHCVIIQLMVIP
jgi:hypothetical protein